MPEQRNCDHQERRSIVFLAWGEKAIDGVAQCINQSRLPNYPIFVLTDQETPTDSLTTTVTVIRRDFFSLGKIQKSAMLSLLPPNLQTVLFLDVDTIVLDDISLGFDMAEKHGIALAPAPHYSLADFRSFHKVMVQEGISPRGQLLYNTGVIFFSLEDDKAREVFERWFDLAMKYPDEPYGDQPFFTLAMEQLSFNPYTLSPSFNHRAFGELISGSLRIWHSYNAMPPIAKNLKPGFLHRYQKGNVIRTLKVPL